MLKSNNITNSIQQKKQQLIDQLDNADDLDLIKIDQCPCGCGVLFYRLDKDKVKSFFANSLEEMQKITIEEIRLNVTSLGEYEVNKEGMLNLLSQLSNPAKEKNK